MDRPPIEELLLRSAGPIASRPNALFRWDGRSAPAVLDGIGSPCGVLGEPLPDGEAEDDDDDETSLPDRFRAWGRAANQAVIRAGGAFFSYAYFRVLIPVDTPPGVLRGFASELSAFRSQGGLQDWAADLATVTAWVDTLGVACVPLNWTETTLALLIAGAGQSHRIDRVKTCLSQSGRFAATIQRDAASVVIKHLEQV